MSQASIWVWHDYLPSSKRGERAVGHRPGNTGQNISILGGLSLEGLIATMTINGSVNTEVFRSLGDSSLSTSTVARFDCCYGQPESSGLRLR